MLLALQSTSEGIDDGTLDAVTLVLLVGFVVSLVALSVLLARNGHEQTDVPPLSPPEREVPPTFSLPVERPRLDVRTMASTRTESPVWLSGVTFSQGMAGLSEASEVIERLLEARRLGDLAAGIALYSPSFRAHLAAELGVSENELKQTLQGATIDGESPALRSVELVSAGEDNLRVRAGYADRSTEVYQLVRIEGRWRIDSIERA